MEDLNRFAMGLTEMRAIVGVEVGDVPWFEVSSMLGFKLGDSLGFAMGNLI